MNTIVFWLLVTGSSVAYVAVWYCLALLFTAACMNGHWHDVAIAEDWGPERLRMQRRATASNWLWSMSIWPGVLFVSAITCAVGYLCIGIANLATMIRDHIVRQTTSVEELEDIRNGKPR